MTGIDTIVSDQHADKYDVARFIVRLARRGRLHGLLCRTITPLENSYKGPKALAVRYNDGVTITHISIVSVPVSDQDRSLKFYVDVLGFELLQDAPMGPMRWVRVAPRGSQSSFTLVTWFATMPPGSLKGLVLETDQLDHDVELLRAKGVVIEGIEEAPWGRFVTFDDPDGNGIVLQHSAGEPR